MRVLFVSAEIYPLAKTGGLADVSAGLPTAMNDLGVEMRLLLPGYPSALKAVVNPAIDAEFADYRGAGPLRLISAQMPDTGLPIWLIDCPSLFERPGGLYLDADGHPWTDNARRFAVFCHVAAQLARGELLPGWQADIVHVNDWHAGLVPAILARAPGRRPATLLTLHNLAYQGLFPAEVYSELGLADEQFSPDGLEFYGQVSFLKAGIRYADRLTTVSPTYAREIRTAEHGCGLDGLLQQRAGDLTGILNGADYHIWDPATDTNLSARFSVWNVEGKAICKHALQDELGLDPDSKTPLVVCVSRITEQKMADIVADKLSAIVALGAQCAVIGDGDRLLEARFQQAACDHPGRIAVRIGYCEPLAHRVIAGGDILLHPARFEPCGLTQIYAMRYGTLPLVRRTGGLRDTVVGASDFSISRGEATGFVFDGATAEDMLRGVEEALLLFNRPELWRKVQRHAMSQDFAWSVSAHRYLALYEALVPKTIPIAPRATIHEAGSSKSSGRRAAAGGNSR